ncbi:hypothetical protein GBA63_22390 (plasmid) [Rubrobacter tropicus]|uniref:Uncharacterized protein n=1 Tax=Rubrobacter tropicus TaxID=2653851 RepID=A0A6G8QG84_9ACTN|nr:hypothetical protein [Rubrobacter tropicus]QIN85453.1 hypothetical protein GBA63_22390 [Rubrobacter tropicus]
MVVGPKNSPSEPGRARPARVDVFRAEELAAGDPRLDGVMIRETLEGEPVGRALGLIRWAKKRSPRNPYRRLRQWARRNERGFYSPALLRRDAGEVYREYLAFVETKRQEHEAATGAPVLPPERLDAVTRTFYAPRSRADLARISPAVWAQFHQELEAEERREDVA